MTERQRIDAMVRVLTESGRYSNVQAYDIATACMEVVQNASERREAFVRDILATMRAELLSAVHKCIADGNTCGAQVYARMLARAYDPQHVMRYLARW